MILGQKRKQMGPRLGEMPLDYIEQRFRELIQEYSRVNN